jgi:hypothetical protein
VFSIGQITPPEKINVAITKPRTVTRAFRFAATRAAARTVVTAAKVLSMIRTSMFYPVKGRLLRADRSRLKCAKVTRLFG